MPRFLVPKKSTPHRVAVIALYRALLSRCTSAPIPDEQRVSLHNAIRNKFRQNRKIQSLYQLGLVFRAGYETLDHLDASRNGSTDSTDFLISLIPILPNSATHAPPQPRPLPPWGPSKDELECSPPTKKVLEVRPYARVSGRRRVPVLASANGIPFLRLGKPQPAELSRILRQKLATRIERFERRILFENFWIPIARQEDNWDEILRKQLGIHAEGASPQEHKWVDVIRAAATCSKIVYEKDLRKDRDTAAKMQAIVDHETALTLKEGQTVMRGSRARPLSVLKPHTV